jgi:hypothetical protein
MNRERICLTTHLTKNECCTVVGLSNTGKSSLLRAVCTAPQPLPGKDAVLCYVDCNRMLDLSEQGFYETILRAVLARLRDSEDWAGLVEQLEHDYHQVVEPHSPCPSPWGSTTRWKNWAKPGNTLSWCWTSSTSRLPPWKDALSSTCAPCWIATGGS